MSLLLTGAGLALATILGLALERSRDTDLADASESVTTEFAHRPPSDLPALELRDVAGSLGIHALHGSGPRTRTLPEDTGSGLAWCDYDGDGDMDLYLVSFSGAGSEASPNRLFRNDGGRFVEVTDRAGVGDPEGFGMGARFADYDGDSFPDLYVTNHGPNRLFRNRGDGTFEEVGERLGVSDDRWSVAAAWGDLDLDGRLDLYVTNYVDFEPGNVGPGPESSDPTWRGVPFTLNPNAFDPQPNSLFLQEPDGGFREVALELGASNPEGRSLAVTVVDLDGDGWLDLYVANDVSANVLLQNLGKDFGTALFEDRGPGTGTADPRGSMGISVTDLATPEHPADGLPDLFVTHWVAQENALYQALVTGTGIEYRDRVRSLRLAEVSTDRVGWGSAFVDLDLDGRMDLAVANGSTLEESADRSRLQAQAAFFFWNGGTRFHDTAGVWGEDAALPRVARGIAVADFDLDGDADVAISVNRGAPVLLRNEGAPKNAWLAVRLETGDARSIGARVSLLGGAETQVRWMGADASFASQHADEILFGLGGRKEGDLEIAWVDGSRRRIQGLPARSRIAVR